MAKANSQHNAYQPPEYVVEVLENAQAQHKANNATASTAATSTNPIRMLPPQYELHPSVPSSANLDKPLHETKLEVFPQPPPSYDEAVTTNVPQVWTTQYAYSQPQPQYHTAPDATLGSNQQHVPPPMEQVPQNDEEENNYAVVFEEQSIRTSFVRKVYAIMMCQMLVALGICALFLFHEPTNQLVKYTMFFWILAPLLVLMCAGLLSVEKLRRHAIGSIVLVISLPLCYGLLLGVISGCFDTLGIMMALSIAVAICLAMTVFASQCFCSSMLNLAMVPALSVIFWYFWLEEDQKEILALVCASIGSFLYCCYLIYSTSSMMYSNKYSVLPNEYLFAVLNFYWDFLIVSAIAALFLAVLVAINVITSFCGVRVCVYPSWSLYCNEQPIRRTSDN